MANTEVKQHWDDCYKVHLGCAQKRLELADILITMGEGLVDGAAKIMETQKSRIEELQRQIAQLETGKAYALTLIDRMLKEADENVERIAQLDGYVILYKDILDYKDFLLEDKGQRIESLQTAIVAALTSAASMGIEDIDRLRNVLDEEHTAKLTKAEGDNVESDTPPPTQIAPSL